MTESIEGVVGTIRALESISGAIASAVTEQEASTRDIAANIAEVARECEEVQTASADMTRSFAMACGGTIRVIWNARGMVQVVDRLNVEVDQFLAKLRSA